MPVNLTVVGQTATGLVRKTNEDAFVIADLTGGSLLGEERVARFEVGQRGVLLAVSDGMGGHQAGEVASALVIESLRRSMAQQSTPYPSDSLLEKAALRANREVWEAAHVPGRQNMGATLTAIFIHGRTAHIAEVGDSRAYLVRGGQIEQVTRDQSYVQPMVDSGAMSTEEAKRSALSSVILQAMGLQESVQIALGRLELRQADCFVLCSDGLSSLVTAEEIRRTVLTSGPLDAVCGKLVERAMRRGGDDNITVIVAGVRGDDLPALVPGEDISDALLSVQDFQPRQPTRA
jgi:serine/threonine protein phosphatase PrpC